MSASNSALQLGLLLWKVKMCQDSVWNERPKTINEIDYFLGEMESALPSLVDRITGHFEKQFETLLRRIEKRHRFIADQNVSHFCSLVESEKNAKNLRVRYHEYLAEETNHMFREWQKEDRRTLRELLATLVATDKRLLGYYEIGNRFGEAVDELKRTTGKLTKKERDYILAGMKKLPMREQKEVEPFFLPTSLGLIEFGNRIKKLGRFLTSHEAALVAKPKWDGRAISYRGESEEVRIQDKSVMTIILDECETQGWPDAIRLSPKLMGNKRSVSNAIYYFQNEHKLVEFSINGDRVIWGPPGTTKRRNA